MKVKAIVAAFAALVASSAAQAADLGYKKPGVVAPIMAQFNWTGFYVGAHVGGRFGNDHTREFVTATGAATGFRQNFNGSGFVGGLLAGYNHQFGKFVAGIEGDAELASYRASYTLANGNGTRSRSDFSGSIRGRLGFLVTDRVMLYGTGGLALANFKHTYFNNVGVTEGKDKFQAGWTLGAGVEAAVTSNILVRAEYRYTDYGRISHGSTVAFPGFTYKHNPRDHAVRAGVAYKF